MQPLKNRQKSVKIINRMLEVFALLKKRGIFIFHARREK
jgi:hypothetical protein